MNLPIEFIHFGQPRSKQRVRAVMRKGGYISTYTPETTRKAERELELSWRAAFRDQSPLTGPLKLTCLFLRKNAQIVDTDNLVKLLIDSGTKARIWRDDSQIIEIHVWKDIDRDRPRTIVSLDVAKTGLRDIPRST